MSASPNWSLLLPDLLRSISEKLISLTDFLRFRAVCSHWRSASSSPPLHLPAQIPWLMLPFDPDPVGSFVVSFYDPVRSKIVKLDLPEMMGQRVCGSSHGWLVLEKVPEVCLFNPITRARISLPSLDEL
ncbi:hypothetical protein LUZ60_004783 [Juncus effusus]|nr:hypothetical protein LUZ60_004783 [Juncus effusus]